MQPQTGELQPQRPSELRRQRCPTSAELSTRQCIAVPLDDRPNVVDGDASFKRALDCVHPEDKSLRL